MMYHFVKNIRDIEKDYSDQDAWPVLFDSFVEFVKAGIKWCCVC